MKSASGVGGAVRLVAALEPRLQRLHAVVVPGKILLRHIRSQLVAQLGVDSGVDDVLLGVVIKAIAELANGAGVDKARLNQRGVSSVN